jgi:catabolite regulation protein CreA
MKKKLLNSEISLEKLSLNNILIDSFEYSNDKNTSKFFLARNSLINTNQYVVREYYKQNTTVILNYEQR